MWLRRHSSFLIALGFGTFTLIGLLLRQGLARAFLDWGTLLAAFALLLGLVNLLLVHTRRTITNRNPYSAVLVITIFIVFFAALLDTAKVTTNALAFLFENVLQPLESALASLLIFFLIFASIRLAQSRQDRWTLIFLGTATLTLIASTQLPPAIPTIIQTTLSQIYYYLNTIIVTAGIRGILIGLALGTITMSLRILAGWEQPYNQ
ncbi:MAG TPA: hypothetical protein VLL52_14725 [Anaerolineae bacterium]|nr:hypothetical protein [Anaerolineae bacterium]